MDFKKWLQIENLAGPGGGPESRPEDQEKLAKNNAHRGVGAFQNFSDQPVTTAKTPTTDYADPRFRKKFMNKNK